MKRKHKNIIYLFLFLILLVSVYLIKPKKTRYYAKQDIFTFENNVTTDKNKMCNYHELRVDDILTWKYLNLSKKSWDKKFNQCENQNKVIELVTISQAKNDKTVFKLDKKLQNRRILCLLRRFDKVTNKSERFMGLVYFEKYYFTRKNKFEVSVDNHGFYNVKCLIKTKQGIKNHYENIYSILPMDMRKLKRDKISYYLNSTKIKPNVLLIGIDSLSRSHFQRVLPKTYKFLTNLQHNHIFNQINSVGINTFPNMIPLLSGIIEEEISTLKLTSEINKYREANTSFHDTLPFIWNEYEKEGYLTMLNQDMPSIAFLNFLKDGFRFKPTPYYTRPYWIKYYNIRSGPFYCHNGIPTYRTYLNNIENFIDRMYSNINQNLPFFSFNFITECTHDHFSIPSNFDDSLMKTLKTFEQKGYFNNTLFILFSDHGARLTKLSYETELGKIEKYQPFLSIRLPTVLRNTQIENNLKNNQNKLIGFFDLFQTLRNFLYLKNGSNNFHHNSINQRHLRGISLFEEIPQHRSCLDALIPEKICLCYDSIQIKEAEFHAETNRTFSQVTQMIVSKINKITDDYRNLCKMFQFKLLNSAKKLVYSDSSILYRFIVILEPGDAWFEVDLQRSLLNELEIHGFITRLSPYAKQSLCMNQTLLRNFCFCKIQE